MSVSKDNTRIIITINKELKTKLIEIAKKEKRTLSNICNKIICDYINKFEKSD